LKYLESIKVVQFFLYEQQEFSIKKITGVFGPNGSGKSSMLDASQIALFGGNSNLLALNAQADDNSTTRNIRSYCLGQYGPNPEDRVRDQATTYITLLFRDSQTDLPITVGVCIYASTEKDGHEVLGRYVLHGIELSMGDHLETIDGDEQPRDWKSFRQQLLQRSGQDAETILFTDSERFIRAHLLALRGSGGAPVTEAFTRAFRFGLRMKFDKTVDNIVRDDVLERKPTNIKKFKDVTDSFKKLAEMVAHVETKINDGEAILKDFTRASAESSRAVTWDALALSAVREAELEKHDQSTTAREQAEARHQEAKIALENSQIALEETRSDIVRLRSLRENHAAHQDSGNLQRLIEEASARVSKGERELNGFLGIARINLTAAAASEHLQDEAADLRACAAGLPESGKAAASMSADALRTALKPMSKILAAACAKTFRLPGTIGRQIEELREQLNEAKVDLERIKEGRPPLTENVRKLMLAMQREQLNPVPVCDLVRITDPAWQGVIEGYLGHHREALLVPAGEEAQSFACYRSVPLYGVKMGMESRQNTNWRPKAGSVAELIEGDSPAAVAYVRAKFGDLMRAHTNAEAMLGPRTLMNDGMYVNGGDIDRIQPVETGRCRIGRVASEQRGALTQQIAALEAQITALEKRDSGIRQLFTQLSNFNSADNIDRAIATGKQVKDALEEQASLTTRLAATADAEYVRLNAELSLASEREIALQGAMTGLHQAESNANSAAGMAIQAERISSENSLAANLRAEEARGHGEFDADIASKDWDLCIDQFGLHYAKMRLHCEDQARLARNRLESARNRGGANFGQFISKYREHVSREVLGDWQQSRAWLDHFIARLRDIELVDYKQEMDHAYQTSQETFKTDVAVLLNANFEWLDRTIQRLNRALKNCPVFTNGERYQFVANPRPQLAHLLKFIKDVAAFGVGGSMFGSAGELPEQFRDLLDDKIATGAAGARSPLDDYREFFEFDIEIQREDAITGATKRIGMLSKRLGPGSGGEHRAPLYVIAGAALASAYRLDDTHQDGLGLILLDEAFNKMDMTNITATMRYLEDIGLQVLMVSPGENLGILTAFLHRYYDIMRDPKTNVIYLEGHDVTEEARELFRSDLPEFHPELIEEELRNFPPTLAPHSANAAPALVPPTLPIP
jgi:chromosome segregation protein